MSDQSTRAVDRSAGETPGRSDASGLKHVAGDVAAIAVEQGSQILEGVKEQVTTFAEQHKEKAAQSVSGIASSMRETGKGLSESPVFSSLIESAANRLEQLASGLRERSFADLYGEAEDYARRSPIVVGGVAVAAGFLLARFIKASADDLSDASAASRTAQARARRPAET